MKKGKKNIVNNIRMYNPEIDYNEIAEFAWKANFTYATGLYITSMLSPIVIENFNNKIYSSNIYQANICYLYSLLFFGLQSDELKEIAGQAKEKLIKIGILKSSKKEEVKKYII